jgi:hypothetical protein
MVRLFIGSSKNNLNVAQLIAIRLKADGCSVATIWDRGVFSPNQATLDGLLSAVENHDYAMLICDLVLSNSAWIASRSRGILSSAKMPRACSSFSFSVCLLPFCPSNPNCH